MSAIGSPALVDKLTKHSDVGLAAIVVSIVGMMIVPLPTWLLDVLLTLNFTSAVALLMVSLYIPSALKISAFPSILLITTLFRLALNVSSTRLILLDADAGEVIESFGEFVVRGNFVVGAVIFLILTLIQFLVVAKGAERVSEVGARFTLDAMPGKQMSIDADLRAGAFDLAEARRRRSMVQRESQLYGAMDGAMKFVKGDAIAGVIITAINILAGMIIGVAQKGMSADEAAETYTLLTIGDGLVSQIPALLIATTAGIIVTRVASGDEGDGESAHLGGDVFGQILAHPKALGITSALLFGLGLIPGLPAVPFFLIGAIVGAIAYGLARSEREQGEGEVEPESAQMAAEASEGARRARELVPAVVPLSVEIGRSLYEAMGEERAQWLEEMLPTVREGVFFERGVKLPGIRLRAAPADLGASALRISVYEVPARTAEVPAGCVLVDAAPANLGELASGAIEARHPTLGSAAAWIGAEHAESARALGHASWDLAEYAALLLTGVARERAADFIGLQDVQLMLEQLEGGWAALVGEVVPKAMSLHALTEVCRRLAAEKISLRHLPQVLEVLAQRAPLIKDPIELTEEVRAGLRRYITHLHAGGGGELAVYLIDQEIEEMIASSVRVTEAGTFLALPPQVSREILDAIGRQVSPDVTAGRAPILLTDRRARRYLYRLASMEIQNVVVLAFQELEPTARVTPIGRVKV